MSQEMKKKVIVIQGNVNEIGQSLTNIFGMNPKIKIHHQFTSTGIRPVPNSGISVPGQNQYEPVTVVFLVYENPGELQGIGARDPNTGPIMSTVKN